MVRKLRIWWHTRWFMKHWDGAITRETARKLALRHINFLDGDRR